ncbi:PREDICTED: F-box protein SKIP3-like [Ipomoea nil]|uniref:F-box protein SKIP3-like n=1 Tax=Ipomoea nil TaxID=35883 RepID=UPI0009011E20|nr:PREDICTED: F-box protein SKIP3-like [Ipomoea nil]
MAKAPLLSSYTGDFDFSHFSCDENLGRGMADRSLSVSGMDFFASLPEGFISDIISLTSAVDAARLSVISKVFKAAAEPDSVWGRFLLQDLNDILLRSRSPVVFSNKKELYFTLCNSPILLNDGSKLVRRPFSELYFTLCNSPILLNDGSKLSFSLDKRSGKKCFMIAARELDITLGMAIDVGSRFGSDSHISGRRSLHAGIAVVAGDAGPPPRRQESFGQNF